MATYVRVCRQPSKPKITVPGYLMGEEGEGEEGAQIFSLTDLDDLSHLKQQLMKLHQDLMIHITQDCQVKERCTYRRL